MTVQVLLSVLDGLALILVLAYFLIRISRLLKLIIATLGKVAFGVRAVETQCAVIGPAVLDLNGKLTHVAEGLEAATQEAEQLARARV